MHDVLNDFKFLHFNYDLYFINENCFYYEQITKFFNLFLF